MQTGEYENGYYYLLSKNYSESGEEVYFFTDLIEITDASFQIHNIHEYKYKVNKSKIYFLIKPLNNTSLPFNKEQDNIEEILGKLSRYSDKDLLNSNYYKIEKSQLNAGFKYKCIYRPILCQDEIDLNHDPRRIDIIDSDYFETPIFNIDHFLADLNQLQILVGLLENIFRYISPTEKNMKTYGHEVRNIIILACTEVETLWKDTLQTNGYKGIKTKDYFKLRDILKLDQYEIEFPFHPEIRANSPFKNWHKDEPTKSLKWYAAYNQIKHDRSNAFDKATLENAIESVSAVAIMMVAKYGFKNVYWQTKMDSFFLLKNIPSWSFADYYIPAIAQRGGRIPEWKEIDFDFSKT